MISQISVTTCSFPLWLSQPARMQGQLVTCHCSHPGCIVAAWTPCSVPIAMCLSQLMVQIHLGHSYLCLMGTVPHKVPFMMGTSLSRGPANPLTLEEEEKKKQDQISPFKCSRSQSGGNIRKTRTQPFSLGSLSYFGASQFHHCSLCIFLLYITSLMHRHQFRFSRL